MWADWSLRMFLRQAPLYGADYVLAPHVTRPDAAVDVAYWMYSHLIGAARDVYGNNETTDEELRKRVFAHVWLAVTPGVGINAQIDAIQSQWTQDMRVLHARLADSPAASATGTGPGAGGSSGSSRSLRRSAARSLGRIRLEAQSRAAAASGDAAAVWAAAVKAAGAAATAGSSTGGAGGASSDEEATATEEAGSGDDWGSGADGGAPGAVAEIDDLTLPRLDGWYGWIPSPAAVSPAGRPAPLVALPPRRSPCDPFWAAASAAAAGGGGGGGDSGGQGQEEGGAVGGPPRLAGSWVLVANASRDPRDADCTYRRILLNMQAAGALGVVLIASPENDVEVMAPEGETAAAELHGAAGGAAGAAASGAAGATAGGAAAAHSARRAAIIRRMRSTAASVAADATSAVPGKEEAQAQQEQEQQEDQEEQQPAIPATMVSYYDGLDLMTLLQEAAARNSSGGGGGGGVVVEFGTTQIPGAWLVADAEAGLAEAGWAALPLMAHAGWAAWWQLCLGRLRADLRRSNDRGDEVVHVMQKQSIAGPHGAVATALVPRAPAARFSRLQLDLALGCEGARFDAGCPAWDHMVQLFVCCEPEERRQAACAACPTTLWGPRGGQGNGGGRAAGAAGAEGLADAAVCGVELGRWATPFRRRVGRWLTDVSPMLAALSGGGKCQFRVQTTPWADGNWTVTLELRLGSGPPAATATTAAAAAAAGATATTGVTGHATATDEQAEQPKLQPGEAQQQEQKQGPGPMQSAGGASGSAGSAERDAALPRAWTASASRRRTALAGPGASQTSAAHDLRRSSSRGAAALPALIRRGKDAPLRPFSYMPLFGSAPFDSQYNTGRQPAAFPTPPGARAAALVGYLTGHGSEPEAGCAEFCPVSHTLYVNGREVAVLDWTDAGTEWGCADDVLHGGVPNQHGTWYYGRGGWCDGAAVRPWIVDITDELLPPAPSAGHLAGDGLTGRAGGSGGAGAGAGAGPGPGPGAGAENNTLWVKGLGPGGREPTDAGSGYIMMSTGVVWYE
ncbi:hypothetical protein HXX76_000881 [Chlamydomonas incerta]|uniref:Peptide-N-glycosidase F N-terminal domain-containing protein n=1 Tax=Chlamydomonas incerta TaxID=51695 RepID=A0A835WF34_CHLIN|nr:hypothetical protein HXX76_000881 [Chlamydomonas incerta]|eukprot:KAG2446292.1 hypothetical protein HXX76_000881 [Chlamydomonas incerta]